MWLSLEKVGVLSDLHQEEQSPLAVTGNGGQSLRNEMAFKTEYLPGVIFRGKQGDEVMQQEVDNQKAWG